VVNDVLEIGGFYFSPGKGISRTELIFCSLISRQRLRVKEAGAEVAIAAHGISVKTLDCRNQFVTSVRTNTAPDAFFRVNLPNEFIAGDFSFAGEKTGSTG